MTEDGLISELIPERQRFMMGVVDPMKVGALIHRAYLKGREHEKMGVVIITTPDSEKCNCGTTPINLRGNHHRLTCPMWTTRDLHARGEYPVDPIIEAAKKL